MIAKARIAASVSARILSVTTLAHAQAAFTLALSWAKKPVFLSDALWQHLR